MHLGSATCPNACISVSKLVCVGTELLKAYCHISLFKLLSFWPESQIWQWEESVEGKDKDVLFLQRYERCVGGMEGKEGTKGLLVVQRLGGREHLS